MEMQMLYGIQGLHTPALDSAIRLIFDTLVGSKGQLWPILGALLLIFPKTRRCGAAVILGYGLAFLVGDVILKNLIARPRPCAVDETVALLVARPGSYSCPSVHTALAFAAAAAVFFHHKKPGVAVHPHDGAEYGKTLIDHIQAYLYAKREWRPREENAFAPALCNRIDRNTGGIVIAAKTAEALRVMNQKIKDREIEKKYLCIVHGTPRPAEGRLEGQLFKDEKQNRVYITKKPQPGSKTCVTLYRTLRSKDGLSLVECELITGRTHQIRAQMADFGHPLLGDGKYGKLDKRYDRKYQALYSYQLTFRFTTDAGALSYLNGRCFQVKDVDFVREYFGENL